ncbi:MAG TPA: dihydrolipoamide acetyltransferase, partial [Gallionellaceae bacterium]|nr:dihydrolipoamide acetyltransferase [Gallionellaceae bacterium]
YEGGTFTVSNLGMFGVDTFVAIINPPQCAILAVGQVAPRAVPHDGAIAARPMMTMTLSSDHRVTDGAVAARFLQEVKGLLEKPAP